MMEKIFLGLDDEITDVVEKMRNTTASDLVLIVPKGATLLQSAVNVRLLKKKSDDLDKKLSVVASDAISKQLASQAGLVVHSSINSISTDAKSAEPVEKQANNQEVVTEVETEVSTQSGEHVHVKHYNASATEALKHFKNEKEVAKDATTLEEPVAAMGEYVDELPASDNNVVNELNVNEVEPKSAEDAEPSLVIGKEFQESLPVATHHNKIKPLKRPVQIPRWLPIIISALIIILLIGSAAVLIIIPTSSVKVSVPAEKLSKKVSTVLDTTISASTDQKLAGLIHDQTIEQTGTANATGKKQVGDKAKGIITVSNSWTSDPITIAKDLVITSDSKHQFRVVAATQIPGVTISKKNGQFTETPGRADVSVIADQPGDQYNLGPTTFSIAGYTSDVSGASAKAFSGGTSRELTIVMEKDIENAKTDASSKLQTSAKELLASQISESEVLINQTVSNVTYTDADHKIGDESNSVSVKASGKAIVHTSNKSDVISYLTNFFKQGLSESKDVVLPDISAVRWGVSDVKDTSLNMSADIDVQVIAKFDTNSLKKQIRLKKQGYVIDKLTTELEAKSVNVEISPAGWKLMPVLTRNIDLKVEE
jgi:hypothetical protein